MVIGFVIRTGFVVGAVYYTRDLGIWGSTEQTDKIYNQIKDELRPHAQQLSKQLPFEIPAMPKSGEISFLANHYYNRGVKSTFHFIEMIPCYTGQLMQKAKSTFDEFSKASPATSTPEKK